MTSELSSQLTINFIKLRIGNIIQFGNPANIYDNLRKLLRDIERQ
ncbi:MAG: hypothetical protein OEM28_08365 [Nitrosopumilus sp.]|nr:hypothetical protein [Nitrosopumilus sp.]MDH3487862.1 hypothetical protein [Nitrosopumilus sp.]